jgi:sporulation protein YlmC with PRC-barrel domain
MAEVGPKPPPKSLMPASNLTGNRVINRDGEDLGKIENLMIDLENGRIAYAVLSFGGFLGLGDKLFAIPWETLALDTAQNRFVLGISRELLEKAPGFDKNNWPDMSDPAWGVRLYSFYGRKPYWE